MSKMMRYIQAALLALAWAGAVWAEPAEVAITAPATTAEVRQFKLRQDDQTVWIPFVQVEGVWVSQQCVQAGRCLALDHLLGAHPAASFEDRRDGFPDSLYCEHLGGFSLTLWEADESATPFCLFKDKSLVSRWPLYQRYRERRKQEFEARLRGR